MVLPQLKFPKIPYGWLVLTPWVLFGLGFLANAIVMSANGGQMPVLYPGGHVFDPDDLLHVAMTHASHLKFLADWVVIRDVGVASPGDFLEWACQETALPTAAAWVALLIKDRSARK